jgi:outer membrane lipoprotein SlyB
VKDVVVDGQKTAIGQYGGAVMGGAVAMPAGGIGGRGDAIMTAAASIAGAVVGQAVEEVVTRKQAQEITVEMKNGDVFTIVQESPPAYREGDRVNVIHGPNGARVELAMDF